MLVALAACLAVSASSAMAGGGGGTKKNATIEVQNATSYVLFVFVDVSDSKIQKASTNADPIAAFKQLGGKQIESSASVSFKVAAGKHNITAVVIDPDYEGQVLIAKDYTDVAKGATNVVVIEQEDLQDVTPES